MTTVTLTRFVGALGWRDQHMVAIQLPPETEILVVGPSDKVQEMLTVQDRNGEEYLVFARDLVDRDE